MSKFKLPEQLPEHRKFDRNELRFHVAKCRRMLAQKICPIAPGEPRGVARLLIDLSEAIHGKKTQFARLPGIETRHFVETNRHEYFPKSPRPEALRIIQDNMYHLKNLGVLEVVRNSD